MKKKLISLLISVTLILNISAFSVSSSTEEIEVYRIMTGVTDGNGSVYDDYYVDKDGTRVDLFSDQSDEVVCAAEDTLPSNYSSVDLGIITAAKDQGGSASCWAFSTVSALETSSIMQGFDTLETADYSEAHLTWFGQNELTTDTSDPTYGDGRNVASPYLTGANWLYSTAALARGAGLQTEANAPWITSHSESVLNTMNYPESDRYTSYLRIKSSQRLADTSSDSIKKAIMEHGSLMAAIYSDYSMFANNYSQYHQNTVSGKTNHAITVVGWDDNYDRKNFNSKCLPQKNGAWLCKNSWGTRLGINGYFWLSYEETSLTNFVYFEAMKADEYENIYQYDGTMMKYIFSSLTAASAANTFTAKRNELLTHVGFFSGNNTADVTIRIYKGESNSKTNPTSGATLIEEATTVAKGVEYGYQTVELARGVYLEEGETFTVMTTFSVANGSSYVLTEGETSSSTDQTRTNYSGNPGESFVCINGYWYDTSSLNGSDHNNVCVKAMTVTDDGIPGDANDDGTVDLKDVVFIRRFLAGGYGVSVNELNGDVDADGIATLADAVLITRYLADGYGVTLK